MTKIRTAIAFLVLSSCGATARAGVTFDWATVGNPDNVDDDTGYGGVAYAYRISKHEVTNAQYMEFLNAVDPTGANALALYNTNMAGNFGGIELQAGNADGAKYVTQVGREQNPVTYVSFFDAMRFVNWLHNGQVTGDTETGTYTIGNGLNELRSVNAQFWIPSEDEWYKAAYQDASAGMAGTYFDFAIGSDSIPASDQPGDNPAAVNYYNNDGLTNGFNDGYAVSGSTSYPSSTNPFTDVGAYTAATSPYGTFDQNGNVSEWNEAVISSSSRGLRGGSWGSTAGDLLAGNRTFSFPSFETFSVGFRVASILEAGVPGDYNGNGVVDAADYTKWRDTLSQSVAHGTGADGDDNGTIEQADYDYWKARFGNTSGSGSWAGLGARGVPEPSTCCLLLATAGLCWSRRWQRA